LFKEGGRGNTENLSAAKGSISSYLLDSELITHSSFGRGWGPRKEKLLSKDFKGDAFILITRLKPLYWGSKVYLAEGGKAYSAEFPGNLTKEGSVLFSLEKGPPSALTLA